MTKEKDISFKSISLIESRFRDLVRAPVWVSDWPEKFDEHSVSEYPYALVMGFFYRRIFQVEHWPKNDFYLFCLSPSVKAVLVELLGFDSENSLPIKRFFLFVNFFGKFA